MEIQGRIKVIGTTKTFGTSGFQKRELVVVTEEQYPQPILIEFTQGNCILLDAFQLGQLVKVNINIRGREWTNPQGEVVYFNSIQGWRIELVQNTPTSAMPTPPPMAPVTPAQAFQTQTPSFEPMAGNSSVELDDDLPF